MQLRIDGDVYTGIFFKAVYATGYSVKIDVNGTSINCVTSPTVFGSTPFKLYRPFFDNCTYVKLAVSFYRAHSVAGTFFNVVYSDNDLAKIFFHGKFINHVTCWSF